METAAKRLFLILWTAIVIIVVGLMALLYVSLIPHFSQIGDIMFVVLCIMLGCGLVILLAFTYSFVNILLSRMRRARNHERLIVAGDVALYLQANHDIYHASAEHNRALIAPPSSVTITEEPTAPATEEVLLELWNKGLSLRDIEKITGEKYHRIQKVTAAQKAAQKNA